MTGEAAAIEIALGDGQRVGGRLVLPADARALFVFAHGAGAGMAHPFMTAVAAGLAGRRIGTLRYNFPAMERGARRPDAPAVAHAAVRAAVDAASRLAPGRVLLAGGKSFGGRMTSQAQAAAPLPGVRGLAFIGFPLHPAGRPGTGRAAHLAQVELPMLFLQGTRDELADTGLLREALAPLAARATLVLLEEADHAFHVPARSGRSAAQVLDELLDAFAGWAGRITSG
jgi:predicted alpha/beta-hydrolase family hydrolase